MGAQNTSNQTAFMGDVHDLARLVAAALLPELRALAQVDPPMSIRDLAAQGVCVFRATSVQLCTIFAIFGA